MVGVYSHLDASTSAVPRRACHLSTTLLIGTSTIHVIPRRTALAANSLSQEQEKRTMRGQESEAGNSDSVTIESCPGRQELSLEEFQEVSSGQNNCVDECFILDFFLGNSCRRPTITRHACRLRSS